MQLDVPTKTSHKRRCWPLQLVQAVWYNLLVASLQKTISTHVHPLAEPVGANPTLLASIDDKPPTVSADIAALPLGCLEQ